MDISYSSVTIFYGCLRFIQNKHIYSWDTLILLQFKIYTLWHDLSIGRGGQSRSREAMKSKNAEAVLSESDTIKACLV